MPLRRIHRDSRHPFEWEMIGFIFVFAIAQMFFDLFPATLTSIIGGTWKYLWGALLLLGSGTTLLGIVFKNDSRGLAMEQSGLIWTAGACLAYSFGLASLGVGSTWLGVTIFIAFGIACLTRAWIIYRDMKAIKSGKYMTAMYDVPSRSEGGGE